MYHYSSITSHAKHDFFFELVRAQHSVSFGKKYLRHLQTRHPIKRPNWVRRGFRTRCGCSGSKRSGSLWDVMWPNQAELRCPCVKDLEGFADALIAIQSCDCDICDTWPLRLKTLSRHEWNDTNQCWHVQSIFSGHMQIQRRVGK